MTHSLTSTHTPTTTLPLSSELGPCPGILIHLHVRLLALPRWYGSKITSNKLHVFRGKLVSLPIVHELCKGIIHLLREFDLDFWKHVDMALRCKFLEDREHHTEGPGLMDLFLAGRRGTPEPNRSTDVGQLLGVNPHL